MTTLTERPFSAANEDGWSSMGDYSIQSDALAPYSPSSVGQIRFQAGFGSGNAPAVLEKVWSGSHKTLYVSAAGSLRYGDIVAVIDAAKGAGVTRVGVITEGMRRAGAGGA